MSNKSERYKRVAIVTGSTSGIGEAAARRFAAAGFGVVGNGRRAEKLAVLEKEIGSAFCSVAGDAADNNIVEQLFTMAKDRFGREADIVVANAGIGMGGKVLDANIKRFEEILRTNVSGVLSLIQKAALKMIEIQQKNYPHTAADIVIVGSVGGRHLSPFSAVYGSSKFAVHALTESLRREIAPKGVRVSLVEPGFVVSGFQAPAGYSDEMVREFKEKSGPLLVGDDIANAILNIVTLPPHVHICDIVVRPTRQVYP